MRHSHCMVYSRGRSTTWKTLLSVQCAALETCNIKIIGLFKDELILILLQWILHLSLPSLNRKQDFSPGEPFEWRRSAMPWNPLPLKIQWAKVCSWQSVNQCLVSSLTRTFFTWCSHVTLEWNMKGNALLLRILQQCFIQLIHLQC